MLRHSGNIVFNLTFTIFRVKFRKNIMNKITRTDYYNLESLLTEDEIMVRNSVGEFVDEKILPIIEKHYHEEKFPLHLVKELGNLGVLELHFLKNTAAPR